MSNERISIKSTRAGVSVSLPEINFKREWTSVRYPVRVTQEQFEAISADPGCINMFKKGRLYIDEGEELIHEYDREHIKVEGEQISSESVKALINMGNVDALRKALKTASAASKESFVDYARTLTSINTAVADVIAEETGTNVMTIVQINAEEAAKAKADAKKAKTKTED